jgi:hypothetical protein
MVELIVGPALIWRWRAGTTARCRSFTGCYGRVCSRRRAGLFIGCWCVRGWWCRSRGSGRVPPGIVSARPLGDRQPGHPGRPAQRSAGPQRPLGAAASGGARCRLVAGGRCHHGDRLRFPPGERGAEQRPAPGRNLPDGYRPGDLGHRSVQPGLGDPNLRVIDGSLHVTNGGGESGSDDLRQCVPDHAYLGGVGSQLPLARIQLSGEAALGSVGPDSQH